MKTKFAFLIGAALITLSFTFASVKPDGKSAAETTKSTVKEPIGGFVSGGQL